MRAHLLLVLLLPLLGGAQEAETRERHPLFRDDTILKAVLTAPISQAYAQRHLDARIYFPGQWTYIDENGKTQRLEVSIRTRGHFRREICELPPLQLNFKKSEVKGTQFAGQNKLKLVAPCRDGKRYQQYVILEYLAYRIYQELTDHSFSTRLIRLSYVDRDEKLEPWTDFAFVIEDDSDLAKRVNRDRLRIESVLYAQLDHPRLAVLQLFQLLIANNDYSVIKPSGDDHCCHNMQLIGDEEPDLFVMPVPYDFDFSGLVNATYAAPPSQIPIRDVRERFYYGLCVPQPMLADAIKRMQSKREDILALVQNSEELDDALRKRNVDFVEDFYEILDDPEDVEKKIVARCRGSNLMNRHFSESTG